MGAVWGRRPGGRSVAPRRRGLRPQLFCRQDGGHSTGLERVSPRLSSPTRPTLGDSAPRLSTVRDTPTVPISKKKIDIHHVPISAGGTPRRAGEALPVRVVDPDAVFAGSCGRRVLLWTWSCGAKGVWPVAQASRLLDAQVLERGVLISVDPGDLHPVGMALLMP